MKYLAIITLFLSISLTTSAQADYSLDVQSEDAILSALYEVISGDAGVERDWDRFRYLFVEEARLIPIRKDEEGKATLRILTPEEYINTSGEYLVKNGFHEVETHRIIEKYGALAHVWSSYESYRQQSDPEPFMRGINSIQMLFDGARWWIVQIYWQGETDEYPMLEKYLPKG